MLNSYSIIIIRYFKRLWRFAITLLLFFCALTYSVLSFTLILIPLILIVMVPWIWICASDIRLTAFFFKVKRELRSHNIQTKIIVVQKIKSDRLYNVEGLSVRAEGIERYILYDTDNLQYRLCAKEEMAALDNLNALNGATLKIDYLLQSRFLLSLCLLKKEEHQEAQQRQIAFEKELVESFQQYKKADICYNSIEHENKVNYCYSPPKNYNYYSKIFFYYFRVLLLVIIFFIFFLCMCIDAIMLSNIFLLLPLLIAIPVFIFFFRNSLKLIKYFFEVKRDFKLHTAERKVITVKKIKSNRLHNYYTKSSAEGIERYILYDEDYGRYFLCARTAKVYLDDLHFLDDTVIQIEYLPQSRFLLSLQLVKSEEANSEEKENLTFLKTTISRSFGHYLSPTLM